LILLFVDPSVKADGVFFGKNFAMTMFLDKGYYRLNIIVPGHV